MLRRPDENSCSHSSAGYDSKNSRVSRPAFPRSATGARGPHLLLPDGRVLTIGVKTQRDTCVSHTGYCLESTAARKSCLKSSARPVCRHRSLRNRHLSDIPTRATPLILTILVTPTTFG